MSTIGTLIARVEARIALAVGLDVQIVDEPRLLEMLRSKYNSLWDETWWIDYMTLAKYDLDTNGLIIGDVTNLINRFVDIHSVFYNELADPIPILKFNLNPNHSRRPCLAPYTSDKTKMFRVIGSSGSGSTTPASVNVWYRTRLRDDQWEQDNDETEVNMDDEMLILGTVFEYLSDDGSNDTAAQKYQALFMERRKQMTKAEFQMPITKSNDRQAWPTEWTING